MPCSQEEADSRLLLHANDAAMNGYTRVMLRATATDVLVIAVAHFFQLHSAELLLASGSVSNYRYIAVHEIAHYALMPKRSNALLGFHALTGCDISSSFHCRSNNSAYNIWNIIDDVTEAFEEMASSSGQMTAQSESTIECFVILMYDKTMNSMMSTMSNKSTSQM